MTTKEQERKALEQIRKIVDDLGEDSYIKTAVAGCFEKAEQNIEYDAAFSLQSELEIARKERDKAISESKFYMEEHNKVQTELYRTRAELEKVNAELNKELDWKDCDGMGTQMSENRYAELLKSGKVMTDEEAIDLIASEFGFAPEKITIIPTVKTYEVNKYGRTRVKETFERKPVYDAKEMCNAAYCCRCKLCRPAYRVRVHTERRSYRLLCIGIDKHM